MDRWDPDDFAAENTDWLSWVYAINDWVYIVPEWLDKSVDYLPTWPPAWVNEGAPDWLIEFLEPYFPDLPHFYVHQNVCEKAFDVGILILTLTIFLFLVFVWRKWVVVGHAEEKCVRRETETDNWAEKTEILSEDLINVEKKVDLIRQTCDKVNKKLQACLQGQGNDGVALDKRLVLNQTVMALFDFFLCCGLTEKKLPAMQLSSCMAEASVGFGEQSVLGNVLHMCGNVEKQLGSELLEYEVEMERLVINKQVEILETDLPNISKQKKHLAKLILDMDSARTRYQTASRHSLQTAGAAKADVIKEEMDDASLKVEQCRDTLAAEMFTLISRECEMAQHLSYLVKCQADYHKKSLHVLENCCQQIEDEISNYPLQPMYGTPLEEHLKLTDRTIALPIEACACFLLECGLSEEMLSSCTNAFLKSADEIHSIPAEMLQRSMKNLNSIFQECIRTGGQHLKDGLFRVAGGASKVKKLTAAFDANLIGIIDMNDYTKDPHAVAGALKSYLRNLPNPLLTHDLYKDWMQAARLADVDARLQALWVVLHKLPQAQFENLRYLMKFLSQIAANHEVNKMSSQNLALIMGPNLLWASDDGAIMNMTMANAFSTIADHLITQADWFFPGDVEFFISSPPAPKSPFEGGFVPSSEIRLSGSNGDLDYSVNGPNENSVSNNSSPQSGASPKTLRRSKKPAPPIPSIVTRDRPLPAERPSISDVKAPLDTYKPTLERKRSTPTETTFPVIPFSAPVPAVRSQIAEKPQIPEKPNLEKRTSTELNKSPVPIVTADASEVQRVPPSPDKFSDEESPVIIRRRQQSPSPADRFDHYRPEWYGSIDSEPSDSPPRVQRKRLNKRNSIKQTSDTESDVTQSSAEDLRHIIPKPDPEKEKVLMEDEDIKPMMSTSRSVELSRIKETCLPLTQPSQPQRSTTPERPVKPPRIPETELQPDKTVGIGNGDNLSKRNSKLIDEQQSEVVLLRKASKVGDLFEPVKPRRPTKLPDRPVRPSSMVLEKPERPDKPPQFVEKTGNFSDSKAPERLHLPPKDGAPKDGGRQSPFLQSASPSPVNSGAEKMQSIKYTLVVGSKKDKDGINQDQDAQMPRSSVPGSPVAPKRPPRPQPPPPLKGKVSSSEDTHL